MLKLRNKKRLLFGLLPIVGLVLIAGGCGRDQVEVYQVAPEPQAPAQPPPGHAHGMQDAHGTQTRPVEVKYQLPDGWRESQADPMRAARLAVPGKDGLDADVSIIPLGGIQASPEDLLNIWRQQLRLSPAAKEDVSKLVEVVDIGQGKGDLADMVSEELLIDSKSKMRILVAMMKKDDTTWFIKMTGPDELVKESRPGFLQFLKSLEFQAASAPASSMAGHGMSAAATASAGGQGKPAWEIPTGWQEQPPSPMLTAKFLVTEGQGSAEISVSSLGGDGGGVLPNVNRWRGQLLLPPIKAEDLPTHTTEVPVGAAKAMLVDFTGSSAKTGDNARMLVLSVPQGGQTWYFKMLGDEQVVSRQKDAFLKFVQSVKYPNAN